MLNPEHRHQRQIDQQRGRERHARRRVDGFWNPEIPEKSNGIKQRRKADCIANETENEHKQTFHGWPASVRVDRM
jgi:hypothetical protein